jgi:hypothetical protein
MQTLAYHAGSTADSAAIAAAAHRTYEDLAQLLTPLIGPSGIDALTSRALHLAQDQYPWLVHRREPGQAQGPFAQVVARVKDQDSADAAEAAGAVLGMLAELLIAFIGESLTTQLLRKAWPDAVSASSPEEHDA